MALSERSIALSKGKIIGLLVAGLAFVVLGVLLVMRDPAEIASGGRFNNPTLVHSAGWLSIAFFGLCSAFALRKLFDQKPGLQLSAAGLQDNASGIAAGLIPWRDIAAIVPYQISGQRMLVIRLHEPEPYIERGSAFRRKLNRANFKLCGSPVSISTNALQIGYEELQRLLQQYLQAYGETGRTGP